MLIREQIKETHSSACLCWARPYFVFENALSEQSGSPPLGRCVPMADNCTTLQLQATSEDKGVSLRHSHCRQSEARPTASAHSPHACPRDALCRKGWEDVGTVQHVGLELIWAGTVPMRRQGCLTILLLRRRPNSHRHLPSIAHPPALVSAKTNLDRTMADKHGRQTAFSPSCLANPLRVALST